MKIPWPRRKPQIESGPPIETEPNTGGEQAREAAEQALKAAQEMRPTTKAVADVLLERRDVFTQAVASTMRRHP